MPAVPLQIEVFIRLYSQISSHKAPALYSRSLFTASEKTANGLA